MTSYGLERDEQVRLAALQCCEELRRRWADHVPAKELKALEFEGERVLMLGPGMGIFKPKELTDGPLTVRTSLDSPYADAVLHGGQSIEYDFAPPAREYDNRGLKELAGLRRWGGSKVLRQLSPERCSVCTRPAGSSWSG